jgi:hypothetical protein
LKSIATAALDALEAGQATVAGAVKLAVPSDPFRVWGGYEPITLAGEVYTGVGNKALFAVSGGQLGGAEVGAEVTLSGVDPQTLGLIDDVDIHGADAVLWRLIFDGAGTTLLQASVYLRGRVDQLPISDTPGGVSQVTAQIEGAARGLGRTGARMRTDADQRMVSATDGSFKRVAYAGQKTLNWGGKPPATAGAAVPNSSDVARAALGRLGFR